MGFKTKILYIAFLLLFATFSLNAAVSGTVADSIGHVLNSRLPGCDESCAYYAGEHSAIGIGNTLLAFVLLASGTVWLYLTYKKKYLIFLGSLLGLAVLTSYFYPQLFVSNSAPKICPVVQYNKDSLAKLPDNVFLAPTSNEFESSDSDSLNTSALSSQPDSTKPGAAATNDEFSTSGDEFESTGDEFTKVDDEFSQNKNLVETPVKVDKKQVLEPILIFLIVALISLMIKYPWFRKTRGLFLLAGLVYLGFYRGACPCMISSFQNTVLALLGVSVKLESLLWFLLLIPGAYFFGKIWCGWLCHLGALQEFIFLSPKIKVLASNKAQKIIKIVQISVFVLWILQLIATKTNLFCEYDPFKVAFNLISASTTGYILLGLLLISSVLIYRPFCRSFCPVGLILGLTSYLPGSRKLDKDSACIHCKSCDKECKQRAMIHENKTTTLRTDDCIMCGECISECKIKALNVKWTKKTVAKN